MTKREARKVALRFVTEVIRSTDRKPAGCANEQEREMVRDAIDHVVRHLEWEADGRRTAFK